MTELEVYKSTPEKINAYLDFELFSLPEGMKRRELYLKAGKYLLNLNDSSKNVYIDFSIEDAVIEEDGKDIPVFELANVPYIDTISKIKHYKEHIIEETCILFEEIYMHEDDIKRNLKKIEYLSQIEIILKKESK